MEDIVVDEDSVEIIALLDMLDVADELSEDQIKCKYFVFRFVL